MDLQAKVRIVDGSEAGAWIGPELNDESGSVGNLVPARYEAIVRVLHPPSLRGDPATWAEVAAKLGRTIHPLAQWDAIVGANRYRGETPAWPKSEPQQGNLERTKLEALCEILARHTAAPERTFFGLWA